MQLRILFSVTVFAVSLASLAQSLAIDQTNVRAFGQTKYTPLLRRLLQITARKGAKDNGGSIEDFVSKFTMIIEKGLEAFKKKGGAKNATLRQSMDCWCAGERCNCDDGRIYDGCVQILDNQLTYMAEHCSPIAATQPITYSCQSDGMEHHDGQMPIRNTAYYRAMCPLADVPECQGARFLAMECWCYHTADCLCGHDKDEQRTFNCISNDPANNSLPLAPVGRVNA